MEGMMEKQGLGTGYALLGVALALVFFVVILPGVYRLGGVEAVGGTLLLIAVVVGLVALVRGVGSARARSESGEPAAAESRSTHVWIAIFAIIIGFAFAGKPVMRVLGTRGFSLPSLPAPTAPQVVLATPEQAVPQQAAPVQQGENWLGRILNGDSGDRPVVDQPAAPAAAQGQDSPWQPPRVAQVQKEANGNVCGEGVCLSPDSVVYFPVGGGRQTLYKSTLTNVDILIYDNGQLAVVDPTGGRQSASNVRRVVRFPSYQSVK